MAIWKASSALEPVDTARRAPAALHELGDRLTATPQAAWRWIERLQEAPARRSRARPLGVVATPHALAAAMSRALLAPVRRGTTLRVLDAGCGDGRLLVAVAREAARRGLRVACDGIEVDAIAARWTQAIEPLMRAGAPAALAAWRVRRMDFLLDELAEEYDAAIANPPYVPWRALEPNLRRLLRARSAGAPGDLAGLFVERMVDRLRPGGRLCVIVPNKLLAARYAAPLRDRLLHGVTIEEIWDLSAEPVFAGHASYPIVLVGRRHAPPVRHRIRCRDADGDLRSRWSQASLRRFPGSLVPLGMAPELAAVAGRLLAGPRLGDAVRVRCGIAATGFGRAVGSGPEWILRSGHVRPFRLLPAARFSPQRAHISERQLARLRCTKVVVPGMFRRLCAAYDPDRRLLGRVYYLPIDGSTPADRNLRRTLLLALLNSRLYALLYAGWFGAVAQSGGYLRLNAPYLESLPWPAREPESDLVAAVAACEREPRTRAARRRLDEQVEALFDLPGAVGSVLGRLARTLPADW